MIMRSALAGLLILTVGGMPATVAAIDISAHCAAVGDNDRVNRIPANLVPASQRIFQLADMPAAHVRAITSFRCMNGKVWLCNSGANLVCGKANTARASRGAAGFCKQSPGAGGVPMAATGHDTIYEWKCVGDQAQIARQLTNVDPRGFIADNWKRLD